TKSSPPILFLPAKIFHLTTASGFRSLISINLRRAGILLHPTSLPGPFVISDLGEHAFRFLDWLMILVALFGSLPSAVYRTCNIIPCLQLETCIKIGEIGFNILSSFLAGLMDMQVLPLVPPWRKANEEGSPYSGQDANCGNTLLISLEELVEDGLLPHFAVCLANYYLHREVDSVDFSKVAEVKDPLAAERLLLSDGELKAHLEEFRADPDISSEMWEVHGKYPVLEDAAYFDTIDNSVESFSWYDWPESLRNCHLAALEEIYQSKKKFINVFIAEQFLFQRQWQKVRNYAQTKGIKIMDDMPIYIGYHNAERWANKKKFLLFLRTAAGHAFEWHYVIVTHSSCRIRKDFPPDAFSEAGQLWDRIDHFRGFAGFWTVPSESKTAMFGSWKAGPRRSLFDAIFRAVGNHNVIAEELDVVQLRRSIGAPGMAVLQFGFGSDAGNPHLPHKHEYNQVVYMGTHDNDTVQCWWDNLNDEGKSNVLKYLSITEEDDISWTLIRAAFSSVARTAIVPTQDILGLGSSARMNVPSSQVFST
ncbi:LOW QUALITY PROTEIN: Glycoside hydrolase, family 77, partial [Dillenia turbinata]